MFYCVFFILINIVIILLFNKVIEMKIRYYVNYIQIFDNTSENTNQRKKKKKSE